MNVMIEESFFLFFIIVHECSFVKEGGTNTAAGMNGQRCSDGSLLF